MFLNIALNSATLSDKAFLITLLHSLSLPTEDLPDTLDNFILAKENGQLVGSAGLEIYESYALLRSVAVDPAKQRSGLGKILCESILTDALEKKVSEIYLITTNAASYFEKQGFTLINRTHVPEAIRQTKQFSGICPASSLIMFKKLA